MPDDGKVSFSWLSPVRDTLTVATVWTMHAQCTVEVKRRVLGKRRT